ncbi:MAG TPA: SDR family NAD(P)-dependent oxidoreductase [Caulobacteraceae bacterium]
MKLTGNTILVTGGGSGIGRGLAEALHALGNAVIIAGRRKAALAEVTAANPGMSAIELDITDPASIEHVAAQLISQHPDLNVLINNAGIMEPDNAGGVLDDARLEATIDTNLVGPIRLTSALIEHLKTRPDAVVAYTSSVLAFTPLALAAVYSATKAALHSYALSQRLLLKDAGVRVLEIAPPWVRTDLLNSREAEAAMPLDQFIAETIEALKSGANEILVAAARPLRDNAGPAEQALMDAFNAQMVQTLGAAPPAAAA